MAIQVQGTTVIYDDKVLKPAAGTTAQRPADACMGMFRFNTECGYFEGFDGASWDSVGDVITENILWTWGLNSQGQLGTNCISARNSPGVISGGGIDWCQTSVGVANIAAVKIDGTLWTWGCNCAGLLGDGTTINRSSPGTTAGGGTTWCQTSTGGGHTAAVKTDGTLWTWGSNSTGQLGDGTITSRSSPDTTAGGGATWCQISAGSAHNAAIKTDGTLWTWGSNSAGQLGDGTITNRSSPGTTEGGGTTWCQVNIGSISSSFSVAIKTDGTLWTWGQNTSCQLGDGTTTNRSSPGTTLGGGTDWCQASASLAHASAVKTDGTLWSWGIGSCGRLGTGNVSNSSSPVSVIGGFTDWCQVSAGLCHSLGVRNNGSLWAWGRNNFALQLGDGTAINRSSPVLVAGCLTNWCQVSTGWVHTAAITVCAR